MLIKRAHIEIQWVINAICDGGGSKCTSDSVCVYLRSTQYSLSMNVCEMRNKFTSEIFQIQIFTVELEIVKSFMVSSLNVLLFSIFVNLIMNVNSSFLLFISLFTFLPSFLWMQLVYVDIYIFVSYTSGYGCFPHILPRNIVQQQSERVTIGTIFFSYFLAKHLDIWEKSYCKASNAI